MSDDKPSIAELQRLERGMTAAPWCRVGPSPSVAIYRDMPSDDVEPDHVCDVFTPVNYEHPTPPECIAEADGIAALRNVVPVLLEIAAAALALRDQEQVAAEARYRVYSTLNKNAVPSDENYAAAGDEDRKLATCREAYRTALAKVRP